MKDLEVSAVKSIIENTDETEYRVGDFLIKHDFGKTAYYVGDGGCVVIPEEVDEDTSLWMRDARNITELHFTGNKKVISAYHFGPDTFGSCDTLTKVVFAEGVTRIIGSACFGDCPNLTSVTLPESLEYLEQNAFRNTPWREENQQQIDGCVYLGNFLVGSEKDVEQVTVREGTKMICGLAFKGRKALKSVQIPESVRGIGPQAFTGCPELERAEIAGNGLRFLADSAFTGCEKLKYIRIPDSCREISPIAFVSNTGKKIYLPDYAYIPYSGDSFGALQKLFYAACYLTSAEDHPQESREQYQALVKKTKSKLLDFILEKGHVTAMRNLAPAAINKKNFGAVLEKAQQKGFVEMIACLLELGK